jgi:hypothetical protein
VAFTITILIKWTQQHIDEYLTIAEVALEQNMDPGLLSFPFFYLSWAALLFALCTGGCMVPTDVVF